MNTDPAPTRPDAVTLAAFAAVVVIGGMNFVAVSVSNQVLDPLWGAGLRFGAAALVLGAAARIAGLRLPRGRALLTVGAYGLLSVASYGLAYTALMPPSGLRAATAAVVVAAVPLFTLVLAVGQRLERFRWRALWGGVLAVAGIALSGADARHGTRLVDLLLIGAFALCLAQATVIAKRFPMGHPLPTVAAAMAVGTVPLLVASRLLGETWVFPADTGTRIAVAYLALIGSGGLLGLFLFVVRRWVASASAFAAVLMPLVSAPAGAVLLGQPVGPLFFVGATVVAGGVYIGALAPSRQHIRPAADAPAQATADSST